jgi:hypothetical protein
LPEFLKSVGKPSYKSYLYSPYMTNFRYPRAEKLKKNTEISLLFEKGKWRTNGNLRIIILKNKPTTPVESTKFAVSVSKNILKKRFTETVSKDF